MKRAIFWSSAVALLAGVLTLGGNAWSQNKDPQAAPAANQPHKIGLIDMAHVFKNYKKFESMREDLKAELQDSETKAKEMQADLVNGQNALKALTEGTKEHTKREQELVKKVAEFESFRRSGQRDFLKKEAGIYLQIYTETSEAVKKYADFYKYTLVMRFNREELETDNPSALLNGMNRQVVYYKQEDDITMPVLDYLNRKYAPAPPRNNNQVTKPAGADKPSRQ